MKKPPEYRAFIDGMVDVCKNGQGQIGARRVRARFWNVNATPEFIPEQHRINVLLARLDASDREVLAKMLADEVVTGVFETLKTLEQCNIAPFDSGYEGSPFQDFIGRMQDWNWPDEVP
jgi:hypothetical protein